MSSFLNRFQPGEFYVVNTERERERGKEGERKVERLVPMGTLIICRRVPTVLVGGKAKNMLRPYHVAH